MKDIQAVIFDMDGLLLDTERIALEAFVAACLQNDFEPDLAVYYRCIGTNAVRSREILINGYGPDFRYDAVNADWQKNFNVEVLEKALPLKTGVLELLRFLNQQQIRKAVVTSTKKKTAEIELAHAGILTYFEFVLGGDQIANGKPHPEIYLKACLRLHLPPKSCLALEDSDNGVRLAAGAGLQIIQVKDLLEPSPEVRALGYPVVDSLLEVQTRLKNRFFS